MKTLLLSLILLLFSALNLKSQESDSLVIRSIYTKALTDTTAFSNLRFLCKNYGARLCGSENSLQAVDWSYNLMKSMGFDTVYKQEMKVIHWERGDAEKGYFKSLSTGKVNVNICALGMSVATPENGIKSKVVEVHNYNELMELGRENIAGKIVFFNRPADPSFIYTFNAYGGAADQRVHGAVWAAELGAVGVIVRSLNPDIDKHPHTGVMRYEVTLPKIPAVAISTQDADLLSKALKEDSNLVFFYKTNCYELPENTSFNVVGEIKGTLYPDEIITIGGHLDGWDLAEGAHDDGAGCIQSMEVLRLFKTIGIHPQHTIRAVMFMDEEIAQRGAKKYLELAKINREKHFFALESDRGGLLPVAFSFDGNDTAFEKISGYQKQLEPYGIYKIVRGGSGVDISPLKEFDIPLMALVPDSQRYFQYHHSTFDVFEEVNFRELQLGTAAMASLIYLVDQHGVH